MVAIGSNSGVYVLMQSSALTAPAFTLEPADMHIGAFGLRFEAMPQFAKRFSLRGTGDNEAALRETFTPAVLTFLLAFAKCFRLWG